MKMKVKCLICIALILLIPSFAFSKDDDNTKNNNSKIKSISVLFIPLKESKIQTKTILRRLPLIFTDDIPDIIVISGKNDIGESEKRIFYDYTIEKGSDYILLKNNDLKIKTRLLPFVDKASIDEAFLTNPTLYLQKRTNAEFESFLTPLKENETPTILFLSLNERAPYDLSLWAEPSRNDVKPYWTIIDTLTNLGYYDAIENSRQNTSASGPVYSDWTYKKDEKNFRLDFIMLKNAAVSDVYTMDIPLLSDSEISRRAIYAHLLVY